MNSFLFFLNYKTSTLKGNALFYQYYNSIIIMVVVNTVVSDFFWLLGMQHAKLPCPSLSPRVCSHSCPLSHWCHPTVSSSVTCFSSCPQSFPVSGSIYPSESALHIRWPKYWGFSFSTSPSNENSGLISFRTWFDLVVQGTLKSLLQHHSSKP